jgi:phosphatidylglycerophosphate synthase
MNRNSIKEAYGDNKWRPLEEQIFLKPISKRVAKIFVNTRISPDHFSLLGFLLTLGASLILLLKVNNHLIFAAIILYLAILCDKIDGDLARLKGIAGRKGQYIDGFLDFVGEGILTISLAYVSNFNNMFILGMAILGPALFNYHSISAPFYLDILPKTHLITNENIKQKIKELFYYGRAKHFLIIIISLLIKYPQLPIYIFSLLIPYTFLIFLKNIFIKKLTKR